MKAINNVKINWKVTMRSQAAVCPPPAGISDFSDCSHFVCVTCDTCQHCQPEVLFWSFGFCISETIIIIWSVSLLSSGCLAFRFHTGECRDTKMLIYLNVFQTTNHIWLYEGLRKHYFVWLDLIRVEASDKISLPFPGGDPALGWSGRAAAVAWHHKNKS